jgi:hypothetical protein
MRISVGLIVIALVFYFIGAKWPMLAQKTGLV